MARLASELKGQAYPLEPDKIRMLWDLFIPSKTSLQIKNENGKTETVPAVKLLDPYCNTGDSIAYAKEKLNLDVYGVEIQRLYAEEAQKKLGLSHVIWGDSHQDVTMSQIAFDVVYLNPPYNEDPGSGMFVSNRAENAALREFWERLQPNGIMIMVMYLHNLNREIIDSFSNRCNKVHFYRFPDLHLGRYTQIVIVGHRDPSKKDLPSKAEVDDRINKNLQMMKDNPDKLPLINQTRTRYALPRPMNKKNFLFVPKKASIKDLADLVATYGAHTTKTFKRIASPVPKEEKVRPINRYHDSQLAMLMSSEIVDNVPIIYTPMWKVNDSVEKGTPVKALLRGSSKQDKYLARTEEKQNSHGDTETYEVHYRKHDTYVSILTEEGVIEVRKGDKVAEILQPYASQLMQYVDANFKPLYDLNIDPFWGETLDNHKVEGVHDMYPAQEQVATATTEYMALERFLIIAAEPRFGKTPVSISLIKNLKKLHDLKVKAEYDDEARSVLDRLCKRFSELREYEVKPKDLGGIAPGEVVVITCPANMPDVWAKMIKLMLPEAKVERIKDVKAAGAFFRQAKTALPTEIYIAISTFEDLKLGGSWSGAWFEYSGKDAYRREVVEENGRQVKKVVKEKYCLDPTTGEQIYAGKDRHRAREADLDVDTYKNVRKAFFEGKVFQGYAEVINTNRYEQDFGKPVKVRDFKTALKRDGYALWQYERKYGFPKQGNGYVDFEEEEYIIPSRSGKMPYWNDKLMNHQNTLKPDGLREYTTKPRAIARKKYLRNLVNPGKRPPDVWLSMQGTRFYEKDGRTFRNPKHPVSDFICRKFSDQIALFIIDEVHAIQATSSGVSEAVRNIAFVAKKTVGLTGTLYRGLASSVYTLLFTFNPDVRQRFPWPYSTTPTEWIDAMGVWRMIFAHKNVYDNSRNTTSTKYEQVSISEAAGYSPEMFKLIAPCAIFATLEDLGQGVPDKTEIPTIIPMAPDQESLYMNVYGRLDQYNKRCIIAGDYSFVGAYYQNVKLMLNGLFRPWTVIHNIRPISNLKTAKPTPVEVLTIPSMGDVLQPKEEKLIERLTEMLADGRKCIVHIEQTGNDGSGGNPGRDISDRITSIIKENVPEANPFVLKAGSPAPAKRSEWIEKRVAEGSNILVCNPRLIKEGVDMSWASYTVFVEIPTRVDVLAQSMMRTMSLKQERDVIIEFMVYDDIFESSGLSYAASKMAAMAMVHGNSYGELAASSEDVDLQEDIMELIKAGRLEELESRRKNAADQIGEQFKKIEYGKDLSRSPWYAPPRKKKEEVVVNG